MDADIADAAELLRQEGRMAFEVEDRTIRLLDPVNGDPGAAVLRVLGITHAASPVGAASHGPGRVAVGVWRSPELYLARWTNGKRWVVGYRLPGGAKPNDYVRTEGYIPTRLETDHWYGEVPAAVEEVFLDAGLLVDDPPFPVPPPPAATPKAPPVPRAPRAPRPRAAPRPKAAPAPRPEPAPRARLCPACRMLKAVGQFSAGSDVCVDCR